MNKKLIALFLPILLVGCNPSVSSQNSNDVNTNSSSVVNVKTYNITIVENPNCKIFNKCAKSVDKNNFL